MMIPPKTIMAIAVPISTWRWPGPVEAGVSVTICLGAMRAWRECRHEQSPSAPAASSQTPPARWPSSLGDEARLGHQVLVALLFAFDPLGVFRADHERLIEGAFLHQL